MSAQEKLIRDDIEAYLKQYQQKELLRFITCGSVDDGKSTLIGRLLHDTKMIYEDQLAAVKRDSEKVGTTGAATALGRLGHVVELVLEHLLGVVQQPADQRALAVVDAAGGEEAQRAVRGRHV